VCEITTQPKREELIRKKERLRHKNANTWQASKRLSEPPMG